MPFQLKTGADQFSKLKLLMKLFHYYLKKKLTMLYQENVKVVTIGDISPFPKVIKDYIKNLGRTYQK